MCDCLSFIAIPERLASWRSYLSHIIQRIISYNGPFTDLHLYPNYKSNSTARLQSLIFVSGQAMARPSLLTPLDHNSVARHPSPVPPGQYSLIRRPPPPMPHGQYSVKPRPPPSMPPGQYSAKPPRHSSSSGRFNPRVRKMSSFHSHSNGSIGDVACLFCQQGNKGANQDAMVVVQDFGCLKEGVFCGVFDGHGPHGHTVAQLVRDFLPQKLASNLKSLQTSVHEKAFSVWEKLFLESFLMMDHELQQRPNIDCFCSGTTAVTLIKEGNNVIIGNVGDSRAILGTKVEDDESLVAVQLTVDLKPNLPLEAERIRKCKGRVFALEDEPEVYRVWLPDEDSPGLAMARAFGDFCLKNFGVNVIPEVTHHELTEKDEFIVLATDGIWDVLSNEEVVNIVSSAPSRPLAARRVVEIATNAWKWKYPTSKVDDCAVVCLFMNGMHSSATSDKQILSMTSTKHVVSARCQKPKPVLQKSETPMYVSHEIKTRGKRYELLETIDGEKWSALDGVTRVNTLVKLPPFSPKSS